MTWIWIIAVGLIIFAGMDWLAVSLYRNKRTLHHKTPGEYGVPFEVIKIPANGGGTLYSWWMPAAADAPVLVLAHGWNSNMSRFTSYMRKLHEAGYSMLAFDARNHGRSSALKYTTVWTFTQDILSAVKYLRESGKTSSQPIGVVGHSAGGSAAVNAASQDMRIQAVLSVGAFAHPVEVMKADFKKQHIPVYPFGWLFFQFLRVYYRIDFDRIAPVNNIPWAAARILLVHGKRDEQVPISQAEALYAAGEPERIRLWVLEESGHNDCHYHPDFWPTVLKFFAQNLR